MSATIAPPRNLSAQRPNALRLVALSCILTFSVIGCADDSTTALRDPAPHAAFTKVTAQATRGATCAEVGALAQNADATMALVCAAEGKRKKPVWQHVGLEQKITETGAAGSPCAKAGELALDETGAVMTCADDASMRGGRHDGK